MALFLIKKIAGSAIEQAILNILLF